MKKVRLDFFRPPAFHSASTEAERRRTSSVSSAPLLVEGTRQPTFCELFYDLVYFLPLHRLGLRCTSADNAADYVFYFAAIFNAWVGEAFWHTRFDNDDSLVHLSTLLCIVGVYGMAAGVVRDASNIFAASYALVRLVLVLKYARTAVSLPEARNTCLKFIACFSVSIALWVLSCAFKGAAQWTCLIAGILIDYASPFALLRSMPSIHRTHMPERCSLFVIMVTSVMVLDFLDDQMGSDVIDGIEGLEDFRDHLKSCQRVMGAVSIPFAFLLLYAFKSRFTLSESPHFSFNDGLLPKLKIYAFIYHHMPLTCCLGLCAMAINGFMATCPLVGQAEWGRRIRKRCKYGTNNGTLYEIEGTTVPPGKFLLFSTGALFLFLATHHALCAIANGGEALPKKRIAVRCVSSGLFFAIAATFDPHTMACSDVLLSISIVSILNVLLDRVEVASASSNANQALRHPLNE